MTFSTRRACLMLAACLLAVQTVRAQTEPKLAQPGGVALSPDGALVAWTLKTGEITTLHLTTVANPDPAKEQLIAPAGGATDCSNSSPAWSPDSGTLAFFSTCTGKTDKAGQQEIFLWSKATGEVKQLTHLTGNMQQPAWSPDGTAIAFLFVENATRTAGALDAMKPWAGVIGEDGVEVQGVYSVQIEKKNTAGQILFNLAGDHWMTPKNLHVYEFAWSPDSESVAFIGAPPPGENTWWIAKLYSAPANYTETSCGVPRKPDATADIQVIQCTATMIYGAPGPTKVVLDPTTIAGPLHGLQIAVPRYSPDGKQIAFIGGLMSDQGSTGGDVWVVDAKGGEPVDVTPGIEGTPTFFVWLREDRLGIVEDRRGHILLPDYDVAKRAYVEGSALDLGEVAVSGGPIKDSISISNPFKSFAFVQSSYNLAPEVWVFSASSTGVKPMQLTHLNDTAAKATQKVESIEWTNDGFHVQGWLVYPKDYDAKKKYPMIVTVHGGPSASAGSGRMSSTWSDRGYFEFLPNPRGSFGQGEAFVQANRKDFGYGDLRDILAGVDAIEKKVSVDDHRLGLTGWSYGGFMTMFAVTQTHRFRAAVAGAGISDWLSYYGENSIDQWMVPFFGATVYDDPAVYAKSSAINYIKNVTTPTLVIVGDRDGECPAPQSFEFWHALRDLGVKTQLVIYPNEGHGFKDAAHIKDREEREVRWFAENMGEAK